LTSSASWWLTIARRVGSIAALVLYTAFIGEVYFRLVDPQALMPRYVTGTPFGVRGNIPNARYWNHTPEVDVEYRINGQGLRADREYPHQKPPGTCRVAVFGDSFFFGIELDVTQTFESQLERRLKEAGYRAEVLNFAVGGFGTAEMLQALDGFGRQFQPDAVIFSWDDSDLLDNVRSGLYRLDDGHLERASAEYLPGVKTSDWLMQHAWYRLIADHSELYSFARDKIEFLVKRHQRRANKDSMAPAEGSSTGATAPPATTAQKDTHTEAADDAAANARANELQRRRNAELASALLLRANDVAHSMGADFYLVEIPWKVSRTEFTPSLDVLSDAVRADVKLVHTAAALSRAARPDRELYFETGQGHLTPVGESILVAETFKQLQSSPQMAGCRSTP